MEISQIVALVLDCLVALIILGMVISGVRKGFLVSLVNAAGYLVSCIGAYIGSRVLAVTIYESFLRDNLISKVSEALAGTVSDADITLQVSLALEGIPGFLRNMVYGFFGSSEDIALAIESDIMNSAGSASAALVDQMLYPVIFVVLQSLCFMLLFAAMRVILSAVIETLRNIRKFPLVGTADLLAGGVMGLIESILVIFVMMLVFRFFISISGGKIPFINEELIETTHIFKLFYKFGPFSGSWAELN